MNQRKELEALEYKMFGEAMFGFHMLDTDFKQLLNIHLITESVMEKIIELVLGKNADAVLSLTLTYKQKLDICSKLVLQNGESALNYPTIRSLRKLDNLRNQLSHTLDNDIRKEELLELLLEVEKNPSSEILNASNEVIMRAYFAHIFPLMFGRQVSS